MTNPNGKDNMSVEKRRRMLIGFGGLAVVLVAVIAFVSPNFRSEDARGAIGAVEKHRAPQIAQSDVVLGDEQTKQLQQVLYGDFLADAAALQNISAELSSEAQSVEMRAELAVRKLDARYADLQMRYQQYAMNALEAMQQLGVEDQLGKAAFQDLSSRFTQQIQAADMEALSVRLRSMADQLETRSRFASVEAQLDAFSLAARRDQQALASMPEAAALENAMAVDNLGLLLRSYTVSLEAMAGEARSIAAFSFALAVKSLDVRALGKVSADLLQQAEQLEVRAVSNMDASLAAHAATVDSLGRMRLTLDAASRSLDVRASSLDAKAVQDARSGVASFSADLQARRDDMQVSSAVGVRSQLAAVNSHLEMRSAAGVRVDTQNLAGRAHDLAVRAADLQARK